MALVAALLVLPFAAWGQTTQFRSASSLNELKAAISEYNIETTNNFRVNITANFSITEPLEISAPSASRTLTISGDVPTRTLKRNTTEDLFRITKGVLIFEDIIIDGDKSNYSNIDNVLVSVQGSEATFTMEDGAVLTNNKTTTKGSGVSVGGGIFTMNGGKISGNTGGIEGGAVQIYWEAIFLMSGGEISDNAAVNGNGGGVCVFGKSFIMNGGTISGNTASADGGGVYVAQDGVFTMNGGTISGNTAVSGGGVFIAGGKFRLEGGVISSGNTASLGGGVYVGVNASFTMNNGTISGNTAVSGGGGVMVTANGAITSFTLGGLAKILGNTKNSDNSANNVSLVNGKYITLGTGVDAPRSGMQIYVQTQTSSGVIVNSDASAGQAQYFHADEAGKVVVFESNQLIIKDIIPIATAAITLTAPVTGATPSTTASGTGNFTVGTVTWSPNPSKFLGSTVYTATVTLTASTGYTFTGLATATINGQTATVTNNTGNTVTLSYTFPATDPEGITAAAITLTAPVTGATPNTTAIGTGNFTVGTVTWSPNSSKFLGSTVYTATVTLTTNNGYTFTGLSTATINGQTATVTNNTGNTVTLSYAFPATTPEGITAVAITLAAPATGTMPNTTAIGTGSFTVGTVTWSPNPSKFLGSTVYTATVTLTANSGYTFTGLASATINGQIATVTNNTSNTVTLSYTFPATTPEEVPKIVISTAKITITAPVTGATPNTTATGTGNFTISKVTWSSNPSKFLGGTVYTATVTLTANNGYTFTGFASATINEQAITPTNNLGNILTLSYTFPATIPEEITAVEITLTAPEIGVTPNTTAIGTGNFTVGTVVWTPNSSKFLSNTVYTATVTLTAKTGYTFTGLSTATINGQTATVINNTGNTVTLSYTFPATVPEEITTVAITLTAPETEATPNTTAIGAGNFAVGTVVWNPNPLKFLGGTVYTATVTLTANIGYTFTEFSTATINGQTAAVTNNTGNTLTLSYTFPPTDLEKITDVAITITAPAILELPSTIAIGTGNFTIGTVAWTPNPSTIFLGSTIYTATVTLTANSGYTFTGLATATINEQIPTAIDNAGNTLTLSYAFPQTDSAELTGIAIKTPPKLEYTYGSQLDLSRLELTSFYNDGTTKDIAFNDFANKNINVNLQNGTPLDIGNYTIIIKYDSFTADIYFTVSKAKLSITANNISIVYGDELPEYTVSYFGFVKEETASVLTGTLAFNSNYATGNGSGEYDIIPSGLSSGNYDITFIKGILTISPNSSYVINFAAINTTETIYIENLSTANKAFFTASTASCKTAEAEIQITITDPSIELQIDGKTLSSKRDANNLTLYNMPFELRSGIDTLVYNFVTNSGNTLRQDTAIIVSPIPFDSIIKEKWGLLIVNSDPESNGGYNLSEYNWFKNGKETGTTLPYYRLDRLSPEERRDPNLLFKVELKTQEEVPLNICEGTPTIPLPAEQQSTYKKQVLGINGKTAGGKAYNIKGKLSTNNVPPGVYIVEEKP